MVSLVFALLSGIFALIAILAHLFEKNGQSKASGSEDAVKAQLGALNSQIQANQNQINQEQQQLNQKEQGETNDSILSAINAGNSSNTPKP